MSNITHSSWGGLNNLARNKIRIEDTDFEERAAMRHRQTHLTAGILLLAECFAVVSGCKASPQGGIVMTLKLSSPDFSAGGNIPKQSTCDGVDISPAFVWSDPPKGTQSFVLIADDPDAPVGTWVHWILFNLPASARSLAQNFPRKEELEDGSRQGRNDFRKIGYGGPCPPPGKPHRYFFRLYALDKKLDLKEGASKQDVENAQRGHILAKGEWMGRYGR